MTIGATIDRFGTAFFGIAARREISDYLKHLALMVFILLLVAWTIDLAGTFRGIRLDATNRGVPVYEILMPYLWYRGADILARTLPMACFFGVFLAEFRRRARLETVILAVGCSSPWRMLASVLVFGLLVGALQFKLESQWRAAAVGAQVELGHGSYAQRFARRWSSQHVWFFSGDVAVRAKILRGQAPEMRDLLIFKGLRQQSLQQVIAADSALPDTSPGVWRLSDARLWDIGRGSNEYATVGDMVLSLDLIPEQLQYHGIPGFYLPNAPLHAIAAMDGAPQTAVDARVAIWRRRTALLLPGVVAFLGVLLARAGYSGRQANVPRLIALGLAGYIAVISIKVLWSVGELGGLPPPVAVGASILYLFAVAAWLFYRQIAGSRRRR